MSLIDLLFPKRCVSCRKLGEFLCPDCFAKIRFNETFQCPVCFRASINGLTHPGCITPNGIDGVISAVIYNRVTKNLIYKFKYAPHISKLDKTIGEIMTEAFSQNESFYSFIDKFKPVLIPIPLSARRLRERGYNHSELLATYVAQYFNLITNNKLLVRVKDTKPQFKLNKEARRKNIEGAFDIEKNIKVPSSIILIDDIATSFATLKEAAKVLKRKGAKKVLGVTFAREV